VDSKISTVLDNQESMLPAYARQHAEHEGLLQSPRRVPVSCPIFEETYSEFQEFVTGAWQSNFDVSGNSYVLLIDEYMVEEWARQPLTVKWPHLQNLTKGYAVKFDNIYNRIPGNPKTSPYARTPKGDPLKVRLQKEGRDILISHICTALEVFGTHHEVQLYTATGNDDGVNRFYRYALKHVCIGEYAADEIDIIGTTHFALARRHSNDV
jgi:hypothetical protein